jgi:drug/metabolite transporter (DMT)-like permease
LEDRRSLLVSHLALMLVAILYGTNYFTLKPVFNEGVDHFAVLAIRCVSVSAIFLLLTPFFPRERIRGKADWLRMIGSALVGVSLNQTFFLWGVSETSRVNGAVLMITSPVFLIFGAAIWGNERVTWRKVLGIALSFAGAAGLIYASAAGTVGLNGASMSGDIKITLNAAFYGVYLLMVRPLLQKYTTLTVMKWLFVIGTLPNLVIGGPAALRLDYAALSWQAIGGIAFLIIFATVIAYFLNAWAMKRLPSSAVGAYVYVQPVFVTLVSAIAGLGELSWYTIPLILLIFAGVYLVTATPVKAAA